MAYSTIPKGSLYMNTKLYTGNGGNDNAQTGVGFQPDWTWIKARSQAYDHMLFDRVRQGAAAQPFEIRSNLTNAQSTDTSGLKSFDSDGFTLNNGGYVNGNGVTFASWNWLANGAGSSNTDGSITSTVSASTTSGFSIVKYTGNDTAGATVGHGLGAIPKMIIIKRYTDVRNWPVYHHSIGNTNNLYLNLTDASSSSTNWNSTTPSDTLFTVSDASDVNGGGGSSNYIAYCFADVQGFSKFGSYIGNGNADGTFIYTGFKPAFLLIKRIQHSTSWQIQDNQRLGYNVNESSLFPDTNGAEGGGKGIDILSNGFKLRSTSGANNSSGDTFIYMAFAENPFVATSGTTAVPVTAR